MEHRKQRLSCAEARAIDIVIFLAGLGYHPVKVRGNDHWYLSPLRKENTASFKVSTRINRWYDFGTGAGGSILDFGMAYYGCSLPEFMERLQGNIALQPLPRQPHSAQKPADKKIIVLDRYPLASANLLQYLEQRRIPIGLAKQYCSEVRFRVGHRSYRAIGFRNNAGGYELRNSWFKGSSSPKSFTTITGNRDTLGVFEGFFDFLSFLVLFPADAAEMDFLILNGLSLFEKARSVIEQYPSVKLFLDNDAAGKNVSAYALSLGKSFLNQDYLYSDYHDLNDMLCGKPFLTAVTDTKMIRPP